MKKLLTIALLLALIYATAFVLRDEILKTINRATAIIGMHSKVHILTIKHYNDLHPTQNIGIDTSVTIHYEYIDGDKDKDIIAIYNSEHTCGEGGCLASIFLHTDTGYEPIPFELGINTYEVLPAITNNMHDLRINKVRLVWNGKSYTIQI